MKYKITEIKNKNDMYDDIYKLESDGLRIVKLGDETFKIKIEVEQNE